jgi:hypothetical protein
VQNSLFTSDAAAVEVEVMVVDDKDGNNVDSVTVDANISFTRDLAERLDPLKRILPTRLSVPIPSLPPSPPHSPTATTSDSVTTTTPTIPHTLLYAISKWTRTEEGAVVLSENSLNPRSFEMVSLLAGSITSPDRRFPAQRVETNSPLVNTRREINDRKAVVSLINALLSVGGSGVATWYGTGVAGWQNEWVRIHPLYLAFSSQLTPPLNLQRALFSLFFALLVAVAEGVLFALWNSRRSKPKRIRGRISRNPPVQAVDVKLKVE